MSFDLNLLQLAKDIIIHKKSVKVLEYGKWNQIHAGSFITAYKDKNQGPISENVWCCMSNGEYVGRKNVVTNVIESAKICATKDSRRTSKRPQMFAIDILSPKNRWKKVKISQMNRNKNQSIFVELTNGSSGVYLPTVWRERPDWSANTLIRELSRKAGGTNNVANIYEIPTYEITETGSEDYGFFSSMSGGGSTLHQFSSLMKTGVIRNMLDRAWKFYEKFAKNKTGQLAYIVELGPNNKPIVSYNNEGALVRTFADLTTYVKLGRYFGGERKSRAEIRVASEIKRLSNSANDIGDLAGWIELLLVYDFKSFQSEICKSTVRLLDTFHAGRFDSADLAFANPQALLAVMNVVEHINCSDVKKDLKSMTNNFLKLYKSRLPMSSSSDVAFAANWLTQSLMAAYRVTNINAYKTFVDRRLVPILQEAIKAQRSITQEATSAHALLISGVEIPDYEMIITRWDQLQKKWKLGGFRYYVDQPWYRTDVTSHVVEVLLIFQG